MKNNFLSNSLKTVIIGLLVIGSFQSVNAQKGSVTINWKSVVKVSKTTPTLQVVVNPMLRKGSPIHEGTFESLKDLGADFVRFVPWFPYPHMAVAELQPADADKNKTYWDFSQIDPIISDFMTATKGHSVVMNFSTIPAWMFKTSKPVQYQSDPNSLCWDYNQGIVLRDSTLKELTDYFGRLFSWYTKGGFTDELGHFHKSGYFYKIPYWEVLNEPDLEHSMSPELYTKIYDAIVTKLKKVSPQTKFIGLGLAFCNNPKWFEYFLNPANHKSGISPDGISYHFYGVKSAADQTISSFKYSFFDQTEGFLGKVRYIENIRMRLSPKTFTTINEIGTIIGEDIPDSYWSLSGAMYAYIYLELTKIGIDVAGESQLVGYPTQYPDVSMMDWKNGKPNARYWVLKLLKDNFGSGDKLVSTGLNLQDVAAQAFITKEGKKLLLINKVDKELQVELPSEANDAETYSVDVSTFENQASNAKINNNSVTLKPFSVTVIKFKS